MNYHNCKANKSIKVLTTKMSVCGMYECMCVLKANKCIEVLTTKISACGVRNYFSMNCHLQYDIIKNNRCQTNVAM